MGSEIPVLKKCSLDSNFFQARAARCLKFFGRALLEVLDARKFNGRALNFHKICLFFMRIRYIVLLKVVINHLLDKKCQIHDKNMALINKIGMLVFQFDARCSTLGNARYACARLFGSREFPCLLDARLF